MRYPEGLPTRDPSRSCIMFSKAGFYIGRQSKEKTLAGRRPDAFHRPVSYGETHPGQDASRVSALGLILLVFADGSDSGLRQAVTTRDGCSIERRVHGGRRLYKITKMTTLSAR